MKLLLAYGADTTVFDYKKRTPLDYAVLKRHNEIAQILINHQNGHFIMSQTGFTPLMLANYCNNKPIVDILGNMMPTKQILDEMTLLACIYTINGNVNQRNMAYCYFEKALNKTGWLEHCTIPCEAYEFFHECQTLDQLASIRNNDNKLRMYALMVSERLLLKMNQINHFIKLLLKQSNIYQHQGALLRCLQLQMHGYQLLIKFNQSKNGEYYQNFLSGFSSLLYYIYQKEDKIPIQSLETIWIWTLNRKNDKKQIPNLFRLLFLITHVCVFF